MGSVISIYGDAVQFQGILDNAREYSQNPNLSTERSIVVAAQIALGGSFAAHIVMPPNGVTARVVAVLHIPQITYQWIRGERVRLVDIIKIIYEIGVLRFGTRISPFLGLTATLFIPKRKFSVAELREILRLGTPNGEFLIKENVLDMLRKEFQPGQIAKLKEIPVALITDPILSDWCCAISKQPLRFPSLIFAQGTYRLCELEILQQNLNSNQFIPNLGCHALEVHIVDRLQLPLEKKIRARLQDIDRKAFPQVAPIAPPQNGQQVTQLSQTAPPPVAIWKKKSAIVALAALEGLGDSCVFWENAARDSDQRLQSEPDAFDRFFVEMHAELSHGLHDILQGTWMALVCLYEQVHEPVLNQPREELDVLLRRSLPTPVTAVVQTSPS